MYFQRLEDLRVDADLTQEQVAQVLHCKREVYRRYEKGIHELPAFLSGGCATQYKISKTYNYSAESM